MFKKKIVFIEEFVGHPCAGNFLCFFKEKKNRDSYSSAYTGDANEINWQHRTYIIIIIFFFFDRKWRLFFNFFEQ